MSLGVVELLGGDVFCTEAGGAEARFAAEGAVARLTGWAARYDAASLRDREDELAAIGREMFARLDEAGCCSERSSWPSASCARLRWRCAFARLGDAVGTQATAELRASIKKGG